MHDIGKMVSVLAIAVLVIMVLITAVAHAEEINNTTDVEQSVNDVVQVNNDVKNVNELKNVNNVVEATDDDDIKEEAVKTNDDGSSTATIRLIDSAGNVLISYNKKLVKGQSWTIQESNVANRIGHIQSEDGGTVNPSTSGARYVHNGHTYSIIGYGSDFPVKVSATGEDYTVDILLNVEQIDCSVTLTYVDNVTGEVIRSTTNNILKGDSWTVEQSQFDNVASNRMNITVDGKNYTFSSFNTTAPLTMEWRDNDYTVVVCLNYDEVIIPPEPVDNSTNNETINTTSNETNETSNNTSPVISDKNKFNKTDDSTNTDTTLKGSVGDIVEYNDTNVEDNDTNSTPVPMLKTGADLKTVICLAVVFGFCLLMISGYREERD